MSPVDTYLSSEIISSDVLILFLQIISAAVVVGIFLGMFIRATWWLWNKI